MTVEGADEVINRLEAIIDHAKATASERTLTEALLAAGAHAAYLTPVDTSALRNSQAKEVGRIGGGWYGVLYYGAEYAPWVHEMSGKLKGQPRSDFGRTRSGISFGGGTGVGNYWDPNAEPEFLKKGMEKMAEEDLPGIIQRNYGV
jgi:hypothetical protein